MIAGATLNTPTRVPGAHTRIVSCVVPIASSGCTCSPRCWRMACLGQHAHSPHPMAALLCIGVAHVEGAFERVARNPAGICLAANPGDQLRQDFVGREQQCLHPFGVAVICLLAARRMTAAYSGTPLDPPMAPIP